MGKTAPGMSATGSTPSSAAIVGELIATAVLVWIVGSLAAADKGNLIPWAVGLWISAAAAFTATGAQANPAVSFGLLFNGGNLQTTGTLVIAQLGGVVLAILGMMFFGKKK